MSLTELRERLRLLASVAEDVRDHAQRVLDDGADVFTAEASLSYVLFIAAEGLALSGVEEVEELVRIVRGGHRRGSRNHNDGGTR